MLGVHPCYAGEPFESMENDMDISTILSALTSAREWAGLIADERDRQKLATIQINLTNQIIEAQVKLSQVLASVIEKDALIQSLTERCRKLEADQTQKARYQLAKLGTGRQFFAYQLRPAAELLENQGEIPHFLCQPCFDAGKKSVLVHNGYGYWLCSLCKVGYQVEPRGPLPRGFG